MNVIVVGGAGFIGSHLVDRLLAEDHAVDVIDNLSSGSLANLADARVAGGALRIHHLDATSSEAASSIGTRRPDVIYHLALLPRPPIDASDHASALTSAVALMEAARRHGVGKVVVALPATAIYGHPPVKALPIKEGDPTQLVARGVRGVVARAIIELLTTYRDLHAIEFTVLALTSVYGPRQAVAGGVVAAFERAALNGVAPRIDGTGRQTRDFLFVDDAVDALVRAGERGGGLVINIGTGVQTSIAELWSLVAAQITGQDGEGTPVAIEPTAGPQRPDELGRFAVSSVRARIHLAWSAWTTLDEGLGRLR